MIKKLLRLIGMDGAIAYSSSARIVQAVSSLLTVLFIATLLSPDEQGYYYTFASVVGIQVFFELGFTGIMTQYVAHEAVHLKLNENLEYDGEEKYKSRLAFLMHFCVKWYSVITILFFVVVNIVGVCFFNRYNNSSSEVDWIGPWILLSFATSVKLFQAPFTSIITGLGKVKEMNKVLFYQQLFVPLSMWLCMLVGLKLYVLGISSLIGVLVWFVYVARTDLMRIVVNLWKTKITEKISYMKEIFPYQWKIALSWISGYFIFQLFNPVLFATEGAVVAGQMGMTISVLNGIQALALSWQNTKIPLYSGLIELKKYTDLDTIFNRTTKQMVGISAFLNVLILIVVAMVKFYDVQLFGKSVGDRILDVLPFMTMSLAIFLTQIIYAWATYLRCHKQEPFLILSVVEGVLCMLSTLLLGNYYGLYGIVIGYVTIILFQTIWAYTIFKNKKELWHK